ncbi:C-terminal region of a alpha amylase (partial) [Bordetella pertussis]|nr:C-terminal region of a alpha amylase (partial) [Bordetella pertussis]
MGPAAVRAAWRLGDGARLTLYANLLPGSVIVPAPPAGQLAYATLAGAGQDLVAGVLRGGCALALWEPAP